MRPVPTAVRLLGAGAILLALAACEAQPIGPFDQPRLASLGGEAQQDVFFRPGAPDLLPGEAARMNGFLQSLALRPQDDVIVTLGETGSPVLDARRAQSMRRAIASGPARLRIVGPLGFGGFPDRPDVALVQARRYDRVLVECPPLTVPGEDVAPDIVPPMGCANAVNRATMAAEKRDLTAPRRLEGSDGQQAVAAIERYRAGRIVFAPLGSSTSGN